MHVSGRSHDQVFSNSVSAWIDAAFLQAKLWSPITLQTSLCRKWLGNTLNIHLGIALMFLNRYKVNEVIYWHCVA
jgi:hypothetical protein